MPKSLKISLLALSVALVLTVFLGVNAHGVSAAGEAAQEGAYKQINVYGEVLQHVQADYVEVPNIPEVTNGAMRGLLESLDADSSYLTPADYTAYKSDRGGKAQVGINVSKRFGYATVISVVPGSPADKEKLTDGDIIEAIGNQDTRDLSLAMIQLLFEGTPGSQLEISVIRPRKADPEKVNLRRVIVAQPPVDQTVYDDGSIVYLKPDTIDKERAQELESKLKSLTKSGNKKILLDLRDVASGDMNDAVRIANFFVNSGTIATLSGQKYATQTFTAEASKAINTKSPLVVLVNRGTSGPAELIAAAIQDDKRGQLVGERTFGEGSLQKTFDLQDGGAVILSIAKYASPAGKQFEKDAVTPGTLVASNADLLDDEDATEADLTKTVTSAGPKKTVLPPDDQLTKALEILRSKSA